ARIGEVVDHQDTPSGAVADSLDGGGDVLEDLQVALVLVIVIARDADALDEPDLEFTGDDGGRHQPAAGDADDGLERASRCQAPCEGAAIAMELIPGDGEGFWRG